MACSLRCQSVMTGIARIHHSVLYSPPHKGDRELWMPVYHTGQHSSTVAYLHLLCRFGCHPVYHASPQSGAWPRSLSSGVVLDASLVNSRAVLAFLSSVV